VPKLSDQTTGLVFRDDKTMYVTARASARIRRFTRDTGTGAMALAGCLAEGDAQCDPGRQMYTVDDMVLTPDHSTLLATAFQVGSVLAYDIAPNGSLRQEPGPGGCIVRNGASACATLLGGFGDVFNLAVSPDGRFGYAASRTQGGLMVFRVDSAAPVCQDRAVKTAVATVVRVQLACADGDGDRLTLSVVDPPAANAVVGAVNSDAQTVDFAPAPGFTGSVTFTYRADDGLRTSQPAKVTVTVDPAASGGGGGSGDPTPAPTPTTPAAPAALRAPGPVGSPINYGWKTKGNLTRVVRLDVRGVPAGGAVALRCAGRSCPFKRKAVPVRGGKADALALLRRARLHTGAQLGVWITKPGAIGKVVVFTMQPGGKLPTIKTLCLPPGAVKPVKRCG
jgi:hypothetical protein